MKEHDAPEGAVVSQLAAFLARHPDAGVAAVADDGLFVPIPDRLAVAGHRDLSAEARAGIALVAAESRGFVLQQFRRLPLGGATEADVVLASGHRGRYALFDTRSSHGVIMLVVVEGELSPGEPMLAPVEAAPAAPRYGRVRRSDVAELLHVDDAVLQMTGYDRPSFEAITTTELVHPEDQEAVVNQWFDMLQSDSTTSRRTRVRYRRQDGGWLWIELTVTNHLDGPDDPHVLSELVDISEEMAAHEEVWRHRELLSRLTEALPIGVVQIDTHRQITYTNDRVAELVAVDGGLGVEDLGVEDLFRLVLDDDRPNLDQALAGSLQDGIDGDVEVRLRIPGASRPRYVQVSLRPLRDRDEQVVGAVACLTDVTESTRMRKELEVRATFDVLTRCYNRATVMAEVDRALAEPTSGVAVVYVDLDGFKSINDSLGHAVGDQLLQDVATALNGVVRTADVVGRIGGDEFLVLCPSVVDADRALEIAERVAAATTMVVKVDRSEVPVRASVGVAWAAADHSIDADQLVARADAAMYRSKRAGQGRAVLG